VYKKPNALNESIGEDDILPPQDTSHQVSTDLKEIFSHYLSSIIGDHMKDVRMRYKMDKMIAHYALVSQLKPKNFKDTNNDSN
jgi:hypothetical protein